MVHRKVQCWIFSRDKDGEPRCLLLKTNQARGEFWQPVTGTVEPHEGYYEAACREPLEETGFEFQAPPLDAAFEFEFSSRFGPARERVFALVVQALPAPRLDPKEHQAFQWLRPEAAIPLLKFPSNIEGLRRTFKLVFGKELSR